MQSEPGHPTGCMVALGVRDAGVVPPAAATDTLTAARLRNREGIVACVQRGIDMGELDPATNIAALAYAFESFLLGLSTLARDGAKQEQMDDAVTHVLSLWRSALNQKA